MSAKLLIWGPIPSPSDWLLAPEGQAPPGYMRLCSLSITRREPAKIAGTDLVPREDIAAQAAMPAELERLLQAFAALDEGGRQEVVRFAETLAGAAP
jgi:hypothetical protein